ncbi:AfsR/SARP family transcriptional regulator [Solwaraspora sp. WMMD406]|uniref:AfsR/SARP family transcriptional regulator n=1 Tax=Solwaraspora sp. WMMD406 TaxID=3016095 RepID=UPI0024165E0B|nr:AfsR/SARP family transcriptional regulator [Solwaraspora sp. WMMD406]MDG4763988.1 AfsR/SARP family transcriptional regulator [Solwaraspora sp. WMMD406]
MTAVDLRYGVLGPLQVLRHWRQCAPTARLQRILLSLLLLNGNETLPVSRLVDGLWGERPPRSAVAALQMYVSAIRRFLEPTWTAAGDARQHPVLVTEPNGYMLRVTVGQVDLFRFRSLATAGRQLLSEGNCGQGAEMIRRSLDVWRGSVLSDVARTAAIERYAVRLEAERLALIQELIAAELCQGKRLELVGELTDLCVQHPLREAFHQQLMLVNYLSGSRAEALAVYQRARLRMVDEAGIEPGPGMRALHQIVLNGAPAPHPHYSATWCPGCVTAVAVEPTRSAACECRTASCRARPRADLTGGGHQVASGTAPSRQSSTRR